MQDFVLSSIPLDQLKLELLEPLKKELQAHFQSLSSSKVATEYITRQDAARLFGISLVTLGQWTKDGTITGYRIGSRVRYIRAELEASLSRINTRV